MAVLARPSTRYFGLRPLDPLKDLRGVADLIEEAFADDLDRSGQNALRELRWLSYMKPVLWWMVVFGTEYSDFLSGFVWEEEGRIVGNVTVSRSSPGSPRWLISNVAVAKSYQGRGIARGMMYAALELVNEYHGSSVSLQVRADNASARHLYNSLNFKEISGTAHLRHKNGPVMAEPALPLLPQSVTLRPRRNNNADTRQAYLLACAAVSPEVQKEWPLRQSRFRLDNQEEFFGNLLHRLTGSGPAAHWVVEKGQDFIAALNIQPGSMGQAHTIELMVHPEWRGQLERPLLSRAMHYLGRWRSREILIKHPADHLEAIEAYKLFGFEHQQTLIWMKQER